MRAREGSRRASATSRSRTCAAARGGEKPRRRGGELVRFSARIRVESRLGDWSSLGGAGDFQSEGVAAGFGKYGGESFEGFGRFGAKVRTPWFKQLGGRSRKRQPGRVEGPVRVRGCERLQPRGVRRRVRIRIRRQSHLPLDRLQGGRHLLTLGLIRLHAFFQAVDRLFLQGKAAGIVHRAVR